MTLVKAKLPMTLVVILTIAMMGMVVSKAKAQTDPAPSTPPRPSVETMQVEEVAETVPYTANRVAVDAERAAYDAFWAIAGLIVAAIALWALYRTYTVPGLRTYTYADGRPVSDTTTGTTRL